MPANKMPEMPDYLDTDLSHMSLVVLHSVVEDYGRACCLAGIAAARECVPDEIHERGPAEKHWNACRDTTLTSLTALEQEAKK